MYNEYEEEYLQNIPDEPAVETMPSFKRNQSAVQNQEVEEGKDDEGTRGDSLPLCYSSFELIQQLIKASKQKRKEREMVQFGNLYRKEDDKKKLPGDPSLAIDTSWVCDEGSRHRKGCNDPQINMFSDGPPSGVPPHKGGICLLGSAGEAEDLPLEAHQAFVAEISGKKGVFH